jgi:hypothetical protein
MPYTITKRGSKFCVVKESDGETVACHATEAKAKRQLAALYASEPRHMESSDMKEFRFVNLLGATGIVRRETYDGREYLVVPVVALVEGVIRAMNSKSPELVRAEKFTLAPSAWDGRPLFAGHPVENGKPISGNTHRVLERSFGHMQNTKADAKRLLSEAWIDIEKAKARPDSNRVLERCLAAERGDADAEVIEVSVGAHVGLKAGSGRWDDGKAYDAEWDVILPDHLALLAEHQVGACSRAMGCGALRAAMVTEDGIEELEGEDAIEAALVALGSPDQPRDEKGRWTSYDSIDQMRVGDVVNAGEHGIVTIKDFGAISGIPAVSVEKSDKSRMFLQSGWIVHNAKYQRPTKEGLASPAKEAAHKLKSKASQKYFRKLEGDDMTESKSLFGRILQGALQVFRAAQPSKEMSDRDLRAKLAAKLREAEYDTFVDVENFWPISDPTHVVYTSKRVGVQPDVMPYPGYVNYEYPQFEREFELSKEGVVSLGATRVEVCPVIYYEPVEGALPETDARYMASELMALAGKRHSSTDEVMLQKMHDMSVDLGATCAEPRNAEAHECACRKNHSQGEGTMDRTKTIAALAANPHSAIKDVKVLEKMDDAGLKALEDGATATESAIKAAKDGQATAEVALKAAQDALAAPIAEERLPAEYRALMSERKAADAKEHGELVAKLKAAQSVYTEEQLKARSLQDLRDLASIAKVEAPSFIGRIVPRAAADGAKSYAPPDPYKSAVDARRAANQ